MSRKSKNTNKKANDALDHLVDINTDFDNLSMAEYKMHFEKCRVDSFRNWPFGTDAQCNPTTLAEAGFYHIPTDEAPDAVRCFVCFKELDGWEPDDCPRMEHKKHSAKCHFLSLKKPFLKLTLNEFFKLECERTKNKGRKHYHSKIQVLEEHAKNAKSELLKLAKK